ncbi:MAG: SpoIIE family protein phosphatase, partial [Bdellovibrionota bacterium]
GGDYFDLAESRHGSQLSIVATDASTYGMSSAVLSALVSVSLKLTADEVRSCVDTVRSIHREMIATLGEKDRLALFYATVSRKDYKMRYLNLGSFGVFHAPAGSGFRRLQPQGGPLARVSSMGLAQVKEVEVALNPDDRIVLLSDGYVEAIAGPGIEQEASVLDLLNRFREKDPKELTNELTFLVKKTLLPEDELPNQDCTALIFDVESKIIRLAS